MNGQEQGMDEDNTPTHSLNPPPPSSMLSSVTVAHLWVGNMNATPPPTTYTQPESKEAVIPYTQHTRLLSYSLYNNSKHSEKL